MVTFLYVDRVKFKQAYFYLELDMDESSLHYEKCSSAQQILSASVRLEAILISENSIVNNQLESVTQLNVNDLTLGEERVLRWKDDEDRSECGGRYFSVILVNRLKLIVV